MLEKFKNINSLLYAVIIILSLIIGLRFFFELSFPDTSWVIQKDEKIELKKERIVMQKFTASQDGLSQIEVLLGNAKIKGIINMKLLDDNCAETLEEFDLRASTIDSEKTYSFNFPKIKDSKDKVFCFTITSKAKKTGSKYPSIFVVNSPAPNGGILFEPEKGQTEKKSLAIRPGYEEKNIWQNLTRLIERISQYKPWFLKGIYLIVVSSLFLILSFALIYGLLALPEEKE